MIHRVASQHQADRQQIRCAVFEYERTPVLEHVTFVAGFRIEREIRVGPVQSLAESRRDTRRAEITGAFLPGIVGVVLVGVMGRNREGVRFPPAHPGVGEAGR